MVRITKNARAWTVIFDKSGTCIWRVGGSGSSLRLKIFFVRNAGDQITEEAQASGSQLARTLSILRNLSLDIKKCTHTV